MTRKFIVGTILATLVGLSAWVSWRWYTTPTLPVVPLDRSDRCVVEMVEEALEDVRRRPRSGEAWGKLAMVLANYSFDDQAAVAYTNAERFDPRNPAWPYLRGFQLIVGHPHQAIPHLRRALALADRSDERAALHFRLALVLIEIGHLKDAEQELQALQGIEAKSTRLQFGQGLLAIAREDYAAARTHLQMLTEHPSSRKKAYNLLASIHPDQELAKKYQQQAAMLPNDLGWPDPFVADLNRYTCERLKRIEQFTKLERQGRLPEALAFLRHFAAEAPDPEVLYILGHTLCQVNELEEGVTVLRAAIRTDPKMVKAHYLLGAALVRMGEKRIQESGGKKAAMEFFRQAVEAEDQALALQRDFGYAHLNRGQALKFLGQRDEALRALRQALLCRPEFADMHLYLGEALAEAGQLPESLEHLENAVRHASAEDLRPRDALKKWRDKSK